MVRPWPGWEQAGSGFGTAERRSRCLCTSLPVGMLEPRPSVPTGCLGLEMCSAVPVELGMWSAALLCLAHHDTHGSDCESRDRV